MKEWRCKCENGLVDTVGEGESETNGESRSTYIPSCVKWIAGEKLLHNTGSPIWHSVMTQGGGMGGGGGRLKRDICTNTADSPCCTAGNQYNIVKKFLNKQIQHYGKQNNK